jgi:hypothetical protein
MDHQWVGYDQETRTIPQCPTQVPVWKNVRNAAQWMMGHMDISRILSS